MPSSAAHLGRPCANGRETQLRCRGGDAREDRVKVGTVPHNLRASKACGVDILLPRKQQRDQVRQLRNSKDADEAVDGRERRRKVWRHYRVGAEAVQQLVVHGWAKLTKGEPARGDCSKGCRQRRPRWNPPGSGASDDPHTCAKKSEALTDADAGPGAPTWHTSSCRTA